MQIIKNQDGITFMGVLFGILIAFIILIIGFSFGHFVNSRYYIDTGDTSYSTNSYEEKDGCVTFVEYDIGRKICGFYTITDRGE